MDIDFGAEGDMQNRRSDKWTLDKRIPIIPAMLLFLQLIGFVWFASKLDSRVTALEDKTNKNDTLVERVIKMEVTMTAMGKSLDRIGDKLDNRPDEKRIR